VDIFNSGHSEALERYALYGLRIYLTGFLFAGINIAGSGYFSASEKVGEAFAISLLRGLVGIVFAGIVLAYFFGLTGVWMAYPVTEGVTMVVTGYFIYKIK
jgi:Na+-driven multidrug efflux pump